MRASAQGDLCRLEFEHPRPLPNGLEALLGHGPLATQGLQPLASGSDSLHLAPVVEAEVVEHPFEALALAVDDRPQPLQRPALGFQSTAAVRRLLAFLGVSAQTSLHLRRTLLEHPSPLDEPGCPDLEVVACPTKR